METCLHGASSSASPGRVGGVVAALTLAALTTLLATPLLDRVALLNIMPLYFIGVVGTSAVYGRAAGVVASLASVLCFDFFFVPPRFSLSVADSESLVSFAVMFGVSLVIGHLGAALREKTDEALRRARELEMLHDLANALGMAQNSADIERRLNAVLESNLNLSARLLLPDTRHKLHAFADVEQDVGTLERMLAEGVWISGQALHANPDIRDDAQTVLLPLTGSSGSQGVLALHERKSPAGDSVPPALCAALATLVAVNLERLALAARLPRGT